MAYNLMLALIKGRRKTKADLAKKANVYYAAGQLSDEEYTEVMEKIEALE